MKEWKKVKLGEICKISAGGDRPSLVSEKETNYCQIPIYSNGIDNQGLYGFTNKAKIKGDAITITGRGANAGTVFYRKTAFYPIIRLLSLEPYNDIINPRYLYYLIKDRTFLSTGSAQPQITVPNISDYVISYNANIVDQQRIATILSRYDSLIENYQKQIKLLEESAQRLYKEWFIDLRFPGHENTKIVDGVPEGWEKKKLGDISKTTSGGTPSRTNNSFYSGSIMWVKTKELCDGFIFNTEEKITEEAIKKSSAKIVPAGSILMAMYGATIGKLGIATKDLTCNQACCVFLISEDNPLRWYIFNWLLQNRNFLISQGKGAAQPNLSQDMIKGFELIIPDDKSIRGYNLLINPIYLNIKSLQSQIWQLTEARDRLLPKLMSGEIDV